MYETCREVSGPWPSVARTVMTLLPSFAVITAEMYAVTTHTHTDCTCDSPCYGTLSIVVYLQIKAPATGMTRTIYTVSQKKRHPFYFCDNLVKCHSVLPILGRNIPPRNLKQNTHLEPTTPRCIRSHYTL